MSRPAERAAALALVALAAALAGDAARAAEPPAGRDVLAVLAPAERSARRGAAIELARRFEAESAYSWILRSLEEECVVFRLPEGRSTGPLLEALSADPRVALAAPVRRFRTLGARPAWNDTYRPLQSGLTGLGLEEAHRVATGRGVRVAVVDTGIDFSHPELAGRVVEARSFVERGEQSFTRDAHGTAVAGVISAAANNGVGIVGVAPATELMALKACWPDPPGSREAACDTYTLARALDHAIVSGARVLNLSLAGPEDPLLGRLLTRAEQAGVVVVAAVDESGEDPFPASHDAVLAVRSETSAIAPAAEAPHRPARLMAPGADILTTGPGASYDFFSGSSFAAAHVSGVAALLLEASPALTPAQVRSILAPAGGGAGNGPVRLSACAALARATGVEVCAPAAPDAGPAPAGWPGSDLRRDPL